MSRFHACLTISRRRKTVLTRAPVDNQSDHTLGIVANQHNYRLGEIRIGEVAARYSADRVIRF
jgi:hypothetical protein